MSTLVFWQNIPSIHQAPLIREIATLWPGEVWVVAETDVSPDRLQQGWSRPDFLPAKQLVAPNRQVRLDLLEKTDDRNCVHIFSGFHAYPETYWTLKQARKTQALIGVFAEHGKGGSLFRSVLRRLRYVVHALQWSMRINILLTTGELGVNWYSKCLFFKKRIFPFGYFVVSDVRHISLERNDDGFNFVFVGNLADWKGLDLLFYALHSLKSMEWTLRIIGNGPLREELDRLARDLNIAGQIIWMGTVDNHSARKVMVASDLLVLPSRYDGWGAVVNEALMSGTPVAVSNACGASDLINNPSLGYVFEANSVESLRLALQSAIKNGPVSLSSRREIREWADRSIHPAVAAQYLIDIINSVRRGTAKPCVPWRKCE